MRAVALGSLLLAIAISPSTSLAAGHAGATLRLKVPPAGEFGLARIFVPIRARPGTRLPRHLSFKVVNAARLRGRYGASLKVLATGSLARGLRIRHHRVYAGVVAVLHRGAGAKRILGGGLNIPPDEVGLRILNLASSNHPKAEYAQLLLDESPPPPAICLPSSTVAGGDSDIVQIAEDSVAGPEEPQVLSSLKPASLLRNAVIAGCGGPVSAAFYRFLRVPKKPLPGSTCEGEQVTLFDNFNGVGVENGGAEPTFSTKGKAYCLTSITTYHWNEEKGLPPGTLGLTAKGGWLGGRAGLGPWPATATPGQNGAPNVNWRVDVPRKRPVIIYGRYACKDSSPATWSQNEASGKEGFCAVQVIPAIIREEEL